MSSIGILLVVYEVSDDPGRPGDQQAADHGQIAGTDGPLTKPDVRSPGLPSGRESEIMPVRGDVA
ncbi:MAG: hypothetical protein ACRDRJ_04045 [Streptosporangiaceae bacterium]